MPEGTNYNHLHVWTSYGISGSADGYLTVGELRNAIAAFPDDVEVIFGPDNSGEPLQFGRFKKRGSNIIAIEFSSPAEQ